MVGLEWGGVESRTENDGGGLCSAFSLARMVDGRGYGMNEMNSLQSSD